MSEKVSITTDEFRQLLNLRMCSDPWAEGVRKDEVDHFFEKVSQEFGYTDWIEAYHQCPESDDQLSAEPFALPLMRFRANGSPTCAIHWGRKEFCPFLRVTGMCGKTEFCGMTEMILNRGGEDGTGFLIPSQGCPVWSA